MRGELGSRKEHQNFNWPSENENPKTEPSPLDSDVDAEFSNSYTPVEKSLKEKYKDNHVYHEDIGLVEHAGKIRMPHEVVESKIRFGNKWRGSTKDAYTDKLAYRDRENELVEAGILFSPEGNKLLHEYPNIVSLIDKGLQYYMMTNKDIPLSAETAYEGSKIIQFVTLDDGIRMKNLSEGNQSHTFRLIIDADPENNRSAYDLVIKAPIKSISQDLSQPYIYEMVQRQQMRAEMANDLKALDVEIPEPLFASGHVFVEKYVKKDKDRLTAKEDLEYEATMYALWVKVHDYIEKKNKSDNELWRNIHPDIINGSDLKLREPNFIASGNMNKWIDPFFYSRRKDTIIKSVEHHHNYSNGVVVMAEKSSWKDSEKMDAKVLKENYIKAKEELQETNRRGGLKQRIKERLRIGSQSVLKKYNLRFIMNNPFFDESHR